jgi:hypothetical protein
MNKVPTQGGFTTMIQNQESQAFQFIGKTSLSNLSQLVEDKNQEEQNLDK